MEEARQYPSVTRVDWVVIGGKVVLLLCSLAVIATFPFVGGRFVIPIGTVWCGVAALVLLIRLGEGAIGGRVRGNDYVSRAERPAAYWAVMIAYGGALIVSVLGFLLMVDLT